MDCSGGVPWVVSNSIFIEPVNGFGADVSLSAVVPEGVTATLDFASRNCSIYGCTDPHNCR